MGPKARLLPRNTPEYPSSLTAAKDHPEEKYQKLDNHSDGYAQAFMESRRRILAMIAEDRKRDEQRQRQRQDSHFPGSTASTATTNPSPPAPSEAQREAYTLLLRARFAQLGARQNGWTIYSPRTSTRACVAIREILSEGDAELCLPAHAFGVENAAWVDRLKRVYWWFLSISAATDFLSAFGMGEYRIGSCVVRVDTLRFADDRSADFRFGDMGCPDRAHEASERAWADLVLASTRVRIPIMPSRPCGCVDMALMGKTLACANGWPEPLSDFTLRWIGDTLVHEWESANSSQAVWPTRPDGKGYRPAEMRFGYEIDLEFSF
ncbi:hypothetical protein Q7P37_000925 [Cladosporium fusiforme]